jgi:ubiquinone/menaquinone biosynthesis C-methylase UbiE
MSGPTKSRRSVSVHDASAWVFNRMADVYDARPPYPPALIDALCELAGKAGHRIGDLGAGIGHLSLPLAARGFALTAVEPAQAMLARLQATAQEQGLAIRAVHAAAEALPLEPACLDLVLIADALHFIDTELAAREIARVLVPRGTLALLTCELGNTPFMRELVQLMEESAPRRPRALAMRRAQLSGIAKVPLANELRFEDETAMGPTELERVLGSISFIGPAMNAERAAAFRERLHALPSPAVWARSFSLRWGKRHRSPALAIAQSPRSSV